MCPVCTVTVFAGLGISRFLGIDDLVTSLWIGGFILSFAYALVGWVNKKWPKIQALRPTVPTIISTYLLVLIPLKQNGSIGIEGNSLWGVDKILLGTLIGSLAFIVGVWADKYERKVKDKILLPFQKVVFPVLALIIVSAVFYAIL